MPSSRATRYGPPALSTLAESIRDAKADEPLAPVTVVVPTNHVGVTARRALARGGSGPVTGRPGTVGSIAVTFLTAFRLAELLGAARLAAQDRRPVAAAVVGAAVRTALREDPGIFAPVAAHPATEEALVATYRELSDLPEAALNTLSAASDRAHDAVRITRTVRAALARDWYDEHDLVDAALEELNRSDHPELGEVVVYLPQDPTRNQARLLRGVAEQRPVTVIAGLAGDTDADSSTLHTLEMLGAPATPEMVSPPDVTPRTGPTRPGAAHSPWPVSAAGTRIVTTTDPDQEVRTAVGSLVDAARAGTPLERMAVLYPLEEPYARLLHEHLTAADVPTNGPSARPLAAHAYGRTLLKLLHLPATGYRRAEVLDLLTSVPLRSPGGKTRSGSALIPTAEWDRLARDAAVVAGREHWDRRLAALADRLDWPAELLVPHDQGPAPVGVVTETDTEATAEIGATDLQGRRADRARTLRKYVLDLLDTLEEASGGPRPWHERVAWLRRTAAHLLGEDRERWPPDEQRAATRVAAALDRLALLDHLDEPCSLEQFARTLELELEADLGRHGRFGEGVLVAPLSFGVGLDLDLLVVVGLADGSLPAQPADDALLPDAERALAGGDLRLRRDHNRRQRRQLMAALASARRHVLLAPRGDLRTSTDRTVSHWLTEMTEVPAVPADAERDRGPDADAPPEVEHQPSFAHRIASAPTPATPQELRLHHINGAPDGDGARGPDDPIARSGTAVLRARESTEFTRYDGNLGHAVDELPRPPTEHVISTTRLEEWARCPHGYFVRYVLGVQPVEDPDDRLTISPLDRGALLHEILDTFVRASLPLGHEDGSSLPLWTDADRDRLRTMATEACRRYEAAGRTGHPLFWGHERARLLDLLDRFLTADNHHRRRSGHLPVASELGFGRDQDPLDPVEVRLPTGRSVTIRGVIDRVDRTGDGRLLVIDYKTGKPLSQKQFDNDPHDRGTRLQLPVYARAARAAHGRPGPPAADDSHGEDSGGVENGDTAVRAEYWFLDRATGLTSRGFDVTAEVMADVSRTVATVVDGIGAGTFPARPTDLSTSPFPSCRFCDPDGLGALDRRRAWERKRHHPALAPYRALAEPEEDTPGTEPEGAP